MSDKHKHIAFLCGHFKRTEDVKPETLQEQGWTLVHYGDVERQKEKRFYYPDFVDFCYGKDMDEGCVRYTRKVDCEALMMVGTEGQQYQLSFTVRELTLYFLPQQMVLYSIHIEQEVSSLDDCSALMYRLRYIDGFGGEDYAVFRDLAIQPIVAVYNGLKDNELQDYTQLVENGNKLRLFQIVHAADASLTSDEARRRRLYQLATFMPVAVGGEFDDDGLFAEHQRKEIENNSVAVFPGWTALALLDSFTILVTEGYTKILEQNWVERYFGMIYINALFQKICLFDFNNRFKLALNKRSRRRVSKLTSEYAIFERNCCFNKISYNFLPLLISDAINDSLETKDEMQQLFNLMAKERTRNEELGRKKMNSLLMAISAVTLFSAIWDACSMLNELFSFDAHFGSSFRGFRIVGGIMAAIVAAILIGVFIYYYFYNRKRGY